MKTIILSPLFCNSRPYYAWMRNRNFEDMEKWVDHHAFSGTIGHYELTLPDDIMVLFILELNPIIGECQK